MKQKRERKISKKKNLGTFPENEAHEFPNKLKGSLMCLQWMKENTHTEANFIIRNRFFVYMHNVNRKLGT